MSSTPIPHEDNPPESWLGVAAGLAIFLIADLMLILNEIPLAAQPASWAWTLRILSIWGMILVPAVGFTIGWIKSYDQGSFFWIVNNINFQYFSILITLISAVVMVVVSYMTPEPNQPQIQGLTFATATAEDKARTRDSWNKWDVIGSLVIMAFIIGAYIYFTG